MEPQIDSFTIASSDGSSEETLSRSRRQVDSRTYRLPFNLPPPEVFTNSTLPPKGEPGSPGARGRPGPLEDRVQLVMKGLVDNPVEGEILDLKVIKVPWSWWTVRSLGYNAYRGE
ncbi:hypothetical protein OS493_016926 [Desmophyllum pertusum]|uniref:Uncharacterized protein n=1 Tax=Desmophyllum pertusum TaxID=174260 RepID=A0A9X0CKK0_9CNID|nr:hypothetical protein OS493_016926 [Desmophyllum pertusum]